MPKTKKQLKSHFQQCFLYEIVWNVFFLMQNCEKTEVSRITAKKYMTAQVVTNLTFTGTAVLCFLSSLEE